MQSICYYSVAGRLAWVCLAVWECDLQAFTWNSDNPGCVSTVCICPLFTFTHTHTHCLTSSQSMPSLGWPIPVCPLSVLCVRGLHNAFSLLANSCVSTVSGVCPQSVYVHCSLYTHYLSTTQSMPSLCWPIHSCVSTVSGVCPRCVYVHCSLSHTLPK